MPQGKVSTKQYSITVAAGESKVGATPATLRRVRLDIQNTGANPGKFRFENAVQNDNGDFILASMEARTFYDPCPIERVSFYSALGTSFAIAETIENG